MDEAAWVVDEDADATSKRLPEHCLYAQAYVGLPHHIRKLISPLVPDGADRFHIIAVMLENANSRNFRPQHEDQLSYMVRQTDIGLYI